jgi:RNA polymerase sigma factor (sigma-70 family)
MSESDQQALYDGHLGLVRHIARQFTSDEDLIDDLSVVGELALWIAAGKFEKKRGFYFSTYAYPCISGSMKRSLRAHAPEWYNNDKFRYPLRNRVEVVELTDKEESIPAVTEPAETLESVILSQPHVDYVASVIFVMHHADGYNFKQIGGLLGLTASKVSWYEKRARNTFACCRSVLDYVKEETK